MARSTLTTYRLPEFYEAGKTALKNLLSQQDQCVSLTTDIWSDRKMRSFLGVTAHIIGKTKINNWTYSVKNCIYNIAQ